MSEPLRILLPGLAMPPEDYARLVASLPGETRVLDSWRTSVTASAPEIRAATGGGGRPAVLIGHSIGALAALEQALLHPDDVEGLVLLDPSTPFRRPSPWGAAATAAAARGPGELLLGGTARARRLGPLMRVAFLRRYGVSREHLDPRTVSERFGTGEGTRLVLSQLAEREGLRARVRALLGRDGATAALPPILQVIGRAQGRRSVDRRRLLARRLGARLEEVDAGHLFCTTPTTELIRLLLA